MPRSPWVEVKTEGSVSAAMPASRQAASATSSATSTEGGARRRSLGASSAGAGRAGRRLGRQHARHRVGARGDPVGQAVAPEADAGDAGGERAHAAAPRPNTSEQLLPPKPKELFIA